LEDKPGKLLLISDGDVIKNQVSQSRQQYFPLGFDRFTNQTFGNKTFLLNAIDYMVDEGGLISLRAKQFRLRLLDAAKVKSDRLYYQMLNTIAPIALVLVFGVVYNYVRRRRYA
jgi:ABC-2 type transport system permease protein